MKDAANRVLLIVLLAILALVAGSSIGSRQALAEYVGPHTLQNVLSRNDIESAEGLNQVAMNVGIGRING